MVINPQNDCTWTLRDGKLSVHLTTDDGHAYIFKTLYRVEDLYEKPEVNASFTIQDAELLTDYQAGIGRVVDDAGALDLGLNAVACQRFTRPFMGVSRYFVQSNVRHNIMRGDLVTIYAVNDRAGDCVVLDPCDADGLTRLMLLNKELVLDVEHDRGFGKGQMIRVTPLRVFGFRALSKSKTRYA